MSKPEDGTAALNLSTSTRDHRIEPQVHLEAVVDCQADAIIAKDLDGTILNWNMGAERLYGYSRQEALGRHISLVVPPELTGEMDWLMQRVKSGHVVEDYKSLGVKKDGSRIHVAITASPIRETAGAIIGITIVGSDIAGRRRDDQALRQQREWLRVTLSSIGDGVLATDAAGRIAFLNPVAAALTGWDEAEALGQPARDVFRIINEETREEAQDIVGLVLREGRVVSLANHTALVSRDGAETPIEDSAAPIRDSAGNVAGAVLVFHDVTGKRRAQEALRESEQRVRRKLDSILSPEGDIGNLELRDIIDVPAVQSLMDNFYKLVHMPMAIIDLKGSVLVGVGWQDVCTKFHRVHPKSCKHCIESDLQLSAGVPPGECRLYRCKNNMWDIATPLTIGGRHVGNLFSGQFFFEGEPLDYEVFRAQAEGYGFDAREYMAALDRVPRLSRDFVDTGMAFLMQLGHTLSLLSYSNLKLARSLSEREALMVSLTDSEARLKRAQAIAHLGNWELDLVNGRLTWSDEVYRIFGLRPQEFEATYEAFLEAVHPEDRAAVDAAYSDSLREGKSSYEITHRLLLKPCGEVRWVEEKCEHIQDAAGRIVRSVGMVQDITERKRLEEQLRAKERRLGLALDGAQAAAWEVNLETGRSFWDERFMALLRIPPEARAEWEQQWADLVVPEDRVRAAAEFAAACEEGGPPYDSEFRARRMDGVVRWYHSHGTMVHESGSARRLVGVVQDITERKRLEEQLRQHIEEIQTVMDVAPVAIWVARDPQCDNITGNRMANEFYEAQHDENVSANVAPARQFFQDGRELTASELPMQQAAAQGADVRGSELEVLLPSGRRIHMLGQATPLRGSDGTVRGCVGTFLDITDRKQTEERLRQAQKLESLGLLAGGVAHDFNNLLVGVIGSASLAQDMLPVDDPAAELLGAVIKNGERAAHLTRQMLAYAGKGKFMVELLNLSDLIPEMTGLVQPSIPKKIALHFELGHDLPALEADRGQIQQIFMNLVLNAAEAIGSATGFISVKTGVREILGQKTAFDVEAGIQPGRYVYLEVRDTGCGIDDQTRARMFDPFFSTKFTGRGLGLAAVAGIVRGHKGAIEVSSAPGRGSSFTVLFPVAEGCTAARVAAAAGMSFQGSGTVLVVDDEAFVREIAKKSLEKQGYRVLVADSGAAAIDMFKRVPDDISLVLLDLSMPGLSGAETLPELVGIRPKVKVLISSGYNEAETLTLFRGLPVAGFVQKPYTAKRLAEKVRSVLQ